MKSIEIFDDFTKFATVLAYIYFYLMLIPMCFRDPEPEPGPDPSDDPDKWQIIGYYSGKVLYEQTYASGKKAWRFKEDGEYCYPRRRDVMKNVTACETTGLTN